MLDLGTPDDFRGDPYGWLTNQMAHVLCGLGGAWLVATLAGRLGIGDLATALARVSGGPVDAAHLLALMAAALASGGLEAVQLSRNGTLTDSIEDFSFVMAGALWAVSGGSLLLWTAVAVAVGLACGTALRSRETPPHKD